LQILKTETKIQNRKRIFPN